MFLIKTKQFYRLRDGLSYSVIFVYMAHTFSQNENVFANVNGKSRGKIINAGKWKSSTYRLHRKLSFAFVLLYIFYEPLLFSNVKIDYNLFCVL